MTRLRFSLKFRLFTGLILTLLILNGCKSRDNTSDKVFKMDIRLNAYPDAELILNEVQPEAIVPLDTINTDVAGKALITIDNTEAGIYMVSVGKKRIIVLSVPGETAVFKADREDLTDLIVEGSVQNTNLQLYHSAFEVMRREVDSLSIYLDRSKDRADYPAVRDSVGMRYATIFDAQQKLTIDYLKSNLTSLGTLIALNQKSGPRPLLTVNDHFGLIMEIDSNLRKHHGNNIHVAYLHKNLAEQVARYKEANAMESRLQPGNPAPEIVMSGHEDENFRLSELKGKVVVLHFWASWLANYRRDFNTLHLIANRYGRYNFDMVSISFDNKRFQWMQAIQSDFMQWTQVCDLLYPSSPLQKLYAIGDNLPTYYIIDRNGLIQGRYNSADDVLIELKKMEW
ncbi:MAG: hypothetical protein A2X09_06640 [Bacteroidetes bacterium GWF2_43_11]|nr:MAG: hypothetical protein A2X09_06640 [Bacteroidetes bacterium GWF2_43_11]